MTVIQNSNFTNNYLNQKPKETEMSNNQTLSESVLKMSELLVKDMTVTDGLVKIDKKMVFATLPDNLPKEQFQMSLDHLAAFDTSFKHALATVSRPVFQENSDINNIVGVASIGHHKFNATVLREKTIRNPTSGEETLRKGVITGGFKLNISTAYKEGLKSSVADLYADLK